MIRRPLAAWTGILPVPIPPWRPHVELLSAHEIRMLREMKTIAMNLTVRCRGTDDEWHERMLLNFMDPNNLSRRRPLYEAALRDLELRRE